MCLSPRWLRSQLSTSPFARAPLSLLQSPELQIKNTHLITQAEPLAAGCTPETPNPAERKGDTVRAGQPVPPPVDAQASPLLLSYDKDYALNIACFTSF